MSAHVYAQSSDYELEPDEEILTGDSETATDGDDSQPGVNTEVVKGQEETEEPITYSIYKKMNPDNPCDRGQDEYDYETTWYDVSQIYINTRFCEPALWFDNFFASDRLFDEGVAGTYVRWRNDFTYDEEEDFKYRSRLNFSIELPGLKQKARLTFEGEDDDLEDVAPGGDSGVSDTLGLQVDLRESSRSKFNINVSLKPRVRLRYRYTRPVSNKITTRFTQELQREGSVNSSRSLYQYEHTFKDDLLLRSSTEAIISELYEGVDWLQAFVLYQRLSMRSVLSYETSASGITQPWTIATNYRVGIRFRRNFHREWLFYEIAPEYTWPVTLDEDRTFIETERRSKWLLLFRLEVHFGNAQKKRYQDYYRR